MIAFIIVIHLIVCALLIGIILIQRGRGGGLVESFSGVESMFGTKTSSFLARTTTILSILFFITCLSLAVLSARQSKSLMPDAQAPVTAQPTAQEETPVVEEAASTAQEEIAVQQEEIPAAQEETAATQNAPAPAAQETLLPVQEEAPKTE